MSTAAQDFITEAKLPIKFNILHFELLQKDNEKICSVYFGKDFGTQEKKEEIGHFIAAAINEKIEREKGERESFNRVEVINHNPHEKEHGMGRTFVSWRGDNHIYTQVQDQGKTLKVFIEEKTKHNTPK